MNLIKKIKNSFIWTMIDNQSYHYPRELENLNPNKFTVDEIAKIMGWFKWVAKFCCNTAVRQGLFNKLDETHYQLTMKVEDENSIN